MEAGLDLMDDVYNPLGIYFLRGECGGNYIENNDHEDFSPFKLDHQDRDDMCLAYSTNRHDNGIDIYVTDGANTIGNLGGHAVGIPSDALIIKGTVVNTLILAHEMGHCLGLFHTHHGNIEESDIDCQGNEIKDENQEPECVGGTCPQGITACGDYVTDTEADPGPGTSGGCTPTGTFFDVCTGTQMNPDLSNIMSRWADVCFDHFSSGQGQRIFDVFYNETFMQEYIGEEFVSTDETWSTPREVENNVYIQPGATLTITSDVKIGKYIFVERGAKLIVDGGKLSPACDQEFWKGIQVWGNAAKEQPDPNGPLANDDAGVVILKNNATIEFARTAISTKLPVYSTPDVEFLGVPFGIPGVRENARQITTNACVVAGFEPDDNALPLNAHIVGSGFGCPCSGVFLSAQATGGATPYQYEWSTSPDGFNWTVQSSSSSFVAILPCVVGEGVFVRLRVTSGDGQTDETFRFIEAAMSWPGQIGECPQMLIDPGNGGVQEATSEVFVFPNPSGDKIKMVFPTVEEPTKTTYGFYDRYGINRLSAKVEIQPENPELEINISNLPSGIYFVKVVLGDKTVTKKVVKH